jgi:hypothetical protein
VSVTTGLAWIVVLMGMLAVWRIFRWKWRPRLEPAGAATSRPVGASGEATWTLAVRNGGAARARRCRARLLRVEREDEHGEYRRYDDGEAFPLTWEDGGRGRDLAPGEEALLTVARGNRLPAGRYRIEIAVIDGEEHRVGIDLAHGVEADAAHGPRRRDEEAR